MTNPSSITSSPQPATNISIDDGNVIGEDTFASQNKDHATNPSPNAIICGQDRQLSLRIRRASLLLSPEWDLERKSYRHLGDLDEDDEIHIAYFPNIPTIQDVTTNSTVKREDGHGTNQEGDGADATATKRDLLEGTNARASVTADEDWSTASVTDDTYSDFDVDHTATGIWQDVPEAAPDAILGIAATYRACKDPHKVNVCVGAYRDDFGKPYVLPTVRKAEYRLLEENEVKEYLPIEGDLDFVRCAMKFAYGRDMDIENHVAAVQSLSGTGACMLGGQFLAQFWGSRHPIYVPDPTWGNHIKIFNQCGLKVRKYRYYDRSKNALDLEGMLKDISRAKDGSIILLHACAHNRK
jgi:hypothetical protein